MKTVTLKEEAYYKLSSLKAKNESFSDLVERLYEQANPSLDQYFGVLKKEDYKKELKDWKEIKEENKKLLLKKIEELESR
ncbi:MAG: hypothetical protein HYW50_01570 [Candidatus Diapherotrites archaeon]|nr:hypothetical protein [Candidatus Diapherotrites archaeon]